MTARTPARPTVPFDFERKAFYTPAEVAGIVGVSDQTILERIHTGKLYAVRLGPRLFRIPLGSLMQFLGVPPAIRRTVDPNAKVDPKTDPPLEPVEHARPRR